MALALRLAHAENSLLALSMGQVDAIVDPSGHAYLLRPAQEHLLKNERRLQAVFDSSADVITVVDRGGVILSQSPAARRVLGYEAAELVGSSIFDLVHEDDLTRLYAAFFNVIEGIYEDAMVLFRHQDRDGAWRMIEGTVGKMPNGSFMSVVFSFRPSTSLRENTDLGLRAVALAQASVAKDHFLAMLSHELRTPLTPVLLGVEELQEDERFSEARPVLAMMRRNLELQARLLEELFDFTKVGLHKINLRAESIDIHEAVGFVVEICRGDLAAAQIEVLLQLRATEKMVLADSVRLQQVMWNLVKNAVKFSTPGSSICITSSNDAPGRLTLAFSDAGIGIEPGLLPLVFDPFQQGEQSSQQPHIGLGLGLFIAKSLTEAQGGTLTVASEGRGKGTTFILTLNASPANQTHEPLTPGPLVEIAALN